MGGGGVKKQGSLLKVKNTGYWTGRHLPFFFHENCERKKLVQPIFQQVHTKIHLKKFACM